MKLRIAPNFTLPAEAVTETFAILGIRGSGKTNTGVVMAEEMLTYNQQVVIIDPVDVWWGLKSGYSIPVIGGDHADLPLEGAAGSVLADFVTDTRASVILSLRNLSMNEQRRFAGDFAKRLYERKGQQRSPLMLMLDEADEFVPQRLPHGHEAMFGAFDRLVRRGRSSGIGVTMISQRPQVCNKDVLSQVGTLICMRVLHKLDRKALEAWIGAHDTENRQAEFMGSLASLGRGDAWVWSPSWMEVFERIHVRERKTFDSSSTPKAGDKLTPPKDLAPVDLGALRERMAATIERQKADDPKTLRARIAELERELKKAPAAAPGITAERESEIRKEAARSAHQSYMEPLRDAVVALEAILKGTDRLHTSLEMAHNIAKFHDVITEPKRRIEPPARDQHQSSPPAKFSRPAKFASPKSSSNGDLTSPEQRILDAIAWLESIGVDAPEQTAVAFLAGYTVGGGAFNNPRGSLRTKGLVLYTGDCMALTDAGQKLAHYPDQVLDSAELQRRVLERLPGPERKILQVLLDAYPKWTDNGDVARAAGYTLGGGAFNNPRGRLRTLGLIEYQSGTMRARDLLFLERGARA